MVLLHMPPCSTLFKQVRKSFMRSTGRLAILQFMRVQNGGELHIAHPLRTVHPNYSDEKLNRQDLIIEGRKHVRHTGSYLEVNILVFSPVTVLRTPE